MGIFLLAVISRGRLNTLYALQHGLQLQPGSVAPVIHALVQEGLLQRSEAKKKRGSKPMAVTSAGEQLLNDRWKEGLEVDREIETIVRGTTVALLMGDCATAIQHLLGAAHARGRGSESAVFDVPASAWTPISLHARMRALFQKRRYAMEAEVLAELGSLIGKSCPDREVRPDRPEE
jgi:hypothetical protein